MLEAVINWLQSHGVWPEQASEYAAQVDLVLMGFILVLILFVGPVMVLLVYFSIKYHENSDADRSGPPTRSIKLELAWSAIPFAVMLGFFTWAGFLYFRYTHPLDETLDIDVVGKQWMWKIQHPGGQREINTLHVPAGRNIRLSLISQDVIHSFYLPALRIKRDVLPDRYSDLYFVADKPGTYHLQCAEYCGTAHARMEGGLVVMEPREYENWLQQAEGGPSPAATGRKLYERYGCADCHGADAQVDAPPLAGVFGSTVKLAGGGTVKADKTYLRTSILLPNEHVVAGYKPIMPSFDGLIGEADLARLVAYLESLGRQATKENP